jgi:hypothetical protein
LSEFAGFGKASAGGDALAEEVVEEDGGAVGGDFDDVFGGVGVGFFEEGDYGFVESFACRVSDFGESGLGVGKGVAELEEGFGDGAGGGAGEANDAYAATSRWGGDGDDSVFLLRHLLMVICGDFFWAGFGRREGVFRGGLRFQQVFLHGFSLVIAWFFVVETW